MNLIKKTAFLLLAFIGCQIFLSCNFNITDIPGPQVSSTIETSKRHGAFICTYTLIGNKINGLQVESFFAEKKYSLSEGLFGKFKIDCCETQLVISLKDDNTIITLNDIPQNWEIIGFKSLNSKIIVKDYKGISFPDSLAIVVRPDVRNEGVFKKLTLYRVK
jgi:hypothetical protein